MSILSEFGDSINDRLEFVRSEFDKSFRPSYSDGMAEYFYVTDVFEDHVVVKTSSQYFKVKFREKGKSLTFQERDKWEAVKLKYVREMLTGHFQDHLVISEFKGKYPEVKIFDDVDIKELTQGNPNPAFVTLPIGMANVTSGNRRFYSDKFLEVMEDQVREKKPVGLMGHLSKEQRSTAFPAEAVHWVGAKRVSEILWGKGYVPDGEPKDRLQRYKATNKKIATSIDATADGVWDEAKEAYVMLPETLELAQIDIAPADRAGIPNLAAVPILTTEMLEENVREDIPYTVRKERPEMGKEETIREMTAEDAALLPQSVLDAIRQNALKQLSAQLGLPEGSNVEQEIQEYQRLREEAQVKDIRDHITELANPDKDTGIKLDEIRELVVDRVMAKSPKSKEEAATLYGEISQSSSIQEMQKKLVRDTMGPPQQPILGRRDSGEKKQGKYFITRE